MQVCFNCAMYNIFVNILQILLEVQLWCVYCSFSLKKENSSIQVLMGFIGVNNMTKMRFQGALALCKHHLFLDIVPIFEIIIIQDTKIHTCIGTDFTGHCVVFK